MLMGRSIKEIFRCVAECGFARGELRLSRVARVLALAHERGELLEDLLALIRGGFALH